MTLDLSRLRALCEAAADGEETMTEEWRAIPGYEGRYEASSTGRIRSLRFRERMRSVPKILKQQPDHRGYLRLRLGKGAAPVRIHRLVLAAFAGPCPDGMEGAHLNGIRTDNRIENLSWKTRAENHADKLIHGTHFRGERSPTHVLTDAVVIELRRRVGRGEARVCLARELGVSLSTVDDAVRGRRFAHLPGALPVVPHASTIRGRVAARNPGGG
jgi:hypothetical protein